MAKKQAEVKKFPCECGKGFKTAAEFSDHVHDAHVAEVGWGPMGAAQAKE